MNENEEVWIRPAEITDAQAILTAMQQAVTETPFLLLEDDLAILTPELESLQIEALNQTANNLILVCLLDKQVIGLLRVQAEQQLETRHIGEVGLFVLHPFWHQGLATALLEECFDWIEQMGVIKRLFLTVQSRNKAALALYQKLDFTEEAVLKKGTFDPTLGYLDVIQMVRFFA